MVAPVISAQAFVKVPAQPPPLSFKNGRTTQPRTALVPPFAVSRVGKKRPPAYCTMPEIRLSRVSMQFEQNPALLASAGMLYELGVFTYTPATAGPGVPV